MTIKTITTVDGINVVDFGNTINEYYWFKNLGDTTVYVSNKEDFKAGDDGVSELTAKGDVTNIETHAGKVYILGSGKVEIHNTDSKLLPFKSAPVAGGGGGEVVYADNSDKLDGHHASDFALKTEIPSALPANGGNADYATNALNATNSDKLDGHHEDYFAKSTNPSIEGEIHLLRSGNATTNGVIFAWEETVRVRNKDPNAEYNTYTDLIVTPLGLFTERMLNGTIALGREKILTQSDIQTNIAGNTIFVKPNTNFPTINSAISKAVSEQKSYIIYISDGTYIEDLDLRDIGNIALEFVGIGNVSVSSGAAYPQGALYCMSNCSFRNISFFSNNSYAVHIEFNNSINSNGNYATYKNVKFENCVFGSDWTQCVGIGLGQGCTVTFTNCVMQRDFYAHNQAKSNVSGQGIRLNGCQIYGNIQIDDAANSNGFSNSVVNIAITNTSAMGFVFVKDRSGSEWVQYDHIPTDDANAILDVVSGGNCNKLNALNN